MQDHLANPRQRCERVRILAPKLHVDFIVSHSSGFNGPLLFKMFSGMPTFPISCSTPPSRISFDFRVGHFHASAMSAA